MNGLDRAQERLWLAWACLTCPKPRGLSIPPHQPGDSPQPMSSSAPLAYYWFQLVPSQRAGWGTPPVLSSHTRFTGADQARAQGSPACASPLGSRSSGAAGKHPAYQEQCSVCRPCVSASCPCSRVATATTCILQRRRARQPAQGSHS